MRYGIISDIHSNLEALKEVLRELSEQKIDRYICMGDVIGYGADPAACVELVKKLKPIIVAGNHEWGYLGRFKMEYFNKFAAEAVAWTKEQLSPEHKEWLERIPLIENIDCLTLVHGSLRDPESFNYVMDYAAAGSTINLLEKSQYICVVGHTHMPAIFVQERETVSFLSAHSLTIEPHNKYLINVGSVGQPRDFDPRASYCIYDTETNFLKIERVEYDLETTQQKIVRAGLPKKLALRLALGR